MAKRKGSHHRHHDYGDLPILHKQIPHVLAYAILIILFVVAVKVVKIVVGVDY